LYGVSFTRALRRRYSVGGGAPPAKNIVGGGAAWAVEFYNFAYLFQKFFSVKNLRYKGMHVQQLFFSIVWPQIRKKIL